MTTPPPAHRHQLADAAWYVLTATADLVTGDDMDRGSPESVDTLIGPILVPLASPG